MKNETLDSLKIIGLYKRTSNDPGVGEKDFPQVWNKFMSENVSAKIPNALSRNIYAVYTEYEGDHTKPYTFMVGCSVSSLDNIPEGMKGVEIDGGPYAKKTVKGSLEKGQVVAEGWYEIWNTELNRAYKSDYEVYDERAMDPSNAVVDIFVSLK